LYDTGVFKIPNDEYLSCDYIIDLYKSDYSMICFPSSCPAVFSQKWLVCLRCGLRGAFIDKSWPRISLSLPYFFSIIRFLSKVYFSGICIVSREKENQFFPSTVTKTHLGENLSSFLVISPAEVSEFYS